MSFSSPGQVMSLQPRSVGIANVSGVAQRARLGPVTVDGTQVGVGDWVLVRHDLALAVVDPAELPLTTSVGQVIATAS